MATNNQQQIFNTNEKSVYLALDVGNLQGNIRNAMGLFVENYRVTGYSKEDLVVFADTVIPSTDCKLFILSTDQPLNVRFRANDTDCALKVKSLLVIDFPVTNFEIENPTLMTANIHLIKGY